ncbi:hypothetical protein BKK52_11340 [Rodentibacter trehalosifermentans]|uniref:Uncharacterized protein n=1 Tax=Rodentibacter trehalosifermentans TaxID=1908263 RepID=A0A1V3IWE0_9PAST|nr:hypothetical protein [Rodentibacter trehalosifermentans]OOF46515.1 hypothetical protein BKK52_11340 [Rodentibacter trehalosifermentans]
MVKLENVLKSAVVVGIAALSLTACKEEAKDYSGSYYYNDKGYENVITFKPTGNGNEYQITYSRPKLVIFANVNSENDGVYYTKNNQLVGKFKKDGNYILLTASGEEHLYIKH